jgi:hypothetical protein
MKTFLKHFLTVRNHGATALASLRDMNALTMSVPGYTAAMGQNDNRRR